MQKAHTAYFSLSALSCRAKALTRLSRSYCDPVQALNCFDRCRIGPEHPRACSTDDVECFFSVLRDNVGSNFTLKRVLYAWRRSCIEFSKRIDPNLPFYYFTSSHDRFHEGARPSFSIPSSKPPSAQRFRRREMLTGQAPGRTSFPAAGSKSTRLTFHNIPINIPPPPSQQSHITDHTYTR
jgi:hypothetical protein